jgi:hypothetical protein
MKLRKQHSKEPSGNKDFQDLECHLESSHSVGCYHCSHIHISAIFQNCDTGESYKGIGKQMINLERSYHTSIVI